MAPAADTAPAPATLSPAAHSRRLPSRPLRPLTAADTAGGARSSCLALPHRGSLTIAHPAMLPPSQDAFRRGCRWRPAGGDQRKVSANQPNSRRRSHAFVMVPRRSAQTGLPDQCRMPQRSRPGRSTGRNSSAPETLRIRSDSATSDDFAEGRVTKSGHLGRNAKFQPQHVVP
jgi:hypothetical protein